MMMRRKQPKKSDSLEVRLPHSVKQTFMGRAKSRGQTASSLLRGFIDSYLADTDPGMENRRMIKRIAKPAAVSTLAATAALLYLTAPVTASAAPDLERLFDKLDRNGDGLLNPEEFVLEDSGGAFAALHDIELGKMLPALFVYHAEGGLTGQAPPGPRLASRLQIVFQGQDSDGNGVVSFGEFEAANLATLRESFEFIDFDDDAGVEQNELREVVGHLPPAAAAKVRPFAEIDSDGNGAISWEEFRG
jgi:Ca2+-binding EF-hand superfamily protein